MGRPSRFPAKRIPARSAGAFSLGPRARRGSEAARRSTVTTARNSGSTSQRILDRAPRLERRGKAGTGPQARNVRSAETLAFEYVSPAFERIFGSSRDEVLHRDPWRTGWKSSRPRTAPGRGRRSRRCGRASGWPSNTASNGPRMARSACCATQAFPSGIRWGMWIAGVGHDATEEAASAERLKVLVAELQHRTRDLLGVVRSVTGRIAASSDDLDDFSARIHDRLGALARVNGLLSRLQEDERIDFDELIRSEPDADGVLDGGGNSAQISLSGLTGVRLRSSTVQTLALGLHDWRPTRSNTGRFRPPTGDLRSTGRWLPHRAGCRGSRWIGRKAAFRRKRPTARHRPTFSTATAANSSDKRCPTSSALRSTTTSARRACAAGQRSLSQAAWTWRRPRRVRSMTDIRACLAT